MSRRPSTLLIGLLCVSTLTAACGLKQEQLDKLNSQGGAAVGQGTTGGDLTGGSGTTSGSGSGGTGIGVTTGSGGSGTGSTSGSSTSGSS